MTHIGLLLFPQLTVLDLIGPYEVFCRLPDTRVDLIWHTLDTVTTEHGLPLQPTQRCADIAHLDVLCIPGGFGVTPLLNDAPTIDFIRRAATHWASMDMLADSGATPTNERFVHDGPVVTGGGVTAGIDFALYLAAQLQNQDTAEAIQLGIEYNPAPPFDAGHPSHARAALVAAARERMREPQARRRTLVQQAAQAMRPNPLS